MMKIRNTLLLIALWPLWATAADKQPVSVQSDAGVFHYDAVAEAPIVSYRVTHPLVGHYGSLNMDIFGDGRVVSTRPTFMNNAGTKQIQLSPSQLDELLSRLLSTRISAFSGRKMSIEYQGLFTVEDADHVNIELNLLTENSDRQMEATAIVVSGEAPQTLSRAGFGQAGAGSLAKADALLRKIALDPSAITPNRGSSGQ